MSKHHAPRAPRCPRCGLLEEPVYAVLDAPPINHRILTGYACPAQACRLREAFVLRERENNAIRAAIERCGIMS